MTPIDYTPEQNAEVRKWLVENGFVPLPDIPDYYDRSLRLNCNNDSAIRVLLYGRAWQVCVFDDVKYHRRKQDEPFVDFSISLGMVKDLDHMKTLCNAIIAQEYPS